MTTQATRVNQTVETPYGKGEYLGRYNDLMIVRVKLNDENRKYLASPAVCMTPHAKMKALFLVEVTK